jgi:hypothetical protein
MNVGPAQGEDIGSGSGKAGPAGPVLRDEDIPAAVVVDYPSDVIVREMRQIEVPLVGEAPDPFARVEQQSRPERTRAALCIDVLPGGHRRLGFFCGSRRGSRACEACRQRAEEDCGFDARHGVGQYGPVIAREQRGVGGALP